MEVSTFHSTLLQQPYIDFQKYEKSNYVSLGPF